MHHSIEDLEGLIIYLRAFVEWDKMTEAITEAIDEMESVVSELSNLKDRLLYL